MARGTSVWKTPRTEVDGETRVERKADIDLGWEAAREFKESMTTSAPRARSATSINIAGRASTQLETGESFRGGPVREGQCEAISDLRALICVPLARTKTSAFRGLLTVAKDTK